MSRKTHLVLSECIKCLGSSALLGIFCGSLHPYRSIGFLVPSYYHYYFGSLGLSQFISPDLKSFLRLCLGLQHMTVGTKDTWHCSLVLSRDTQLTWENYRKMIWVVARFVCCLTLQNPSLRGIEPRLGPVDGGTLVTLFGDKLNTGADQFVHFAGRRCNVSRYVTKWRLIAYSVLSVCVCESIVVSRISQKIIYEFLQKL